MSAIAYANRPSQSYRVVMLLMLIAAAVALPLSAHAVEKHGAEAEVVAKCAGKPEITMYNPVTHRTAHVCSTELGWGVYIQSSNGDNVTAFVKRKMKDIQDVIRYLKNAGYR